MENFTGSRNSILLSVPVRMRLPSRADGDRLVGLAGTVLDLAGVEDVDLGDFDLLVNLPLLELLVARLIHRRRLLPGRFEIEAFEQVGQVGADGVALKSARHARRT